MAKYSKTAQKKVEKAMHEKNEVPFEVEGVERRLLAENKQLPLDFPKLVKGEPKFPRRALKRQEEKKQKRGVKVRLEKGLDNPV